MIETLESRRLLSALPISERPVETEPRTIKIVSLEEFLQMESWNDDEIVVEWYSTTSTPSDGGSSGEDDEDWQYELEEEDMPGEDGEGWLDDVCDGAPLDGEEALDDEDWEAVEDSEVLDAPIVFDVSDDISFSEVGGIADDILEAGEDGVLA